jgi:hypothetical protein
MYDLAQASAWLENLPWATAIRESTWMFPTAETVHVFGLVIVVGSIFTVDVLLLGVRPPTRSFDDLAREMLPWTWSAFIFASIAGAIMFSSKATTYAFNIPFRVKMICLGLAGINMLLFNLATRRKLTADVHGKPPAAARFAGGASLLLWTSVVAAGRWIGFTT